MIDAFVDAVIRESRMKTKLFVVTVTNNPKRKPKHENTRHRYLDWNFLYLLSGWSGTSSQS